MSTTHTSSDAAKHSLVIGFAIIGMITATGLFLLPTNSTAEKQGSDGSGALPGYTALGDATGVPAGTSVEPPPPVRAAARKSRQEDPFKGSALAVVAY